LRFSKEIIQEIKRKTDIVSIVSMYVKNFKKSGKNWLGLCPFHNDRHPSFYVSEEYGIYKCFSCGEKGDVIEFLQKIEGITFNEAVESLAKKCGIELINNKNGEDYQENYKRKDEIIQFNARLIKLFNFFLIKRKEGEDALKYLFNRNIDKNIIDLFKIGYAPRGYRRLENFLKKKGFKEDFLIETGLFTKVENSLKCLFFDRIMFPIINYKGECVGFGGRVINPDAKPKYINSPETMVYKKSLNLYGINLSKEHIQKEKRAYIVEGYVDVISCYKSGLKNVVAPCGTAVTKEQIKILSRYADEIVLLLDGDEAGLKGAVKALFEMADIENIKSMVLVLPDGMDPDDYFKNNSIEDFNIFATQRISAIDFLFFYKTRNVNLKEYDKLIDCLNFLFDYVKLWNSEVIRETLLSIIAEKFKIEKNIVIREYNSYLNNKLRFKKETVEYKKEENIKKISKRDIREIELILFLSNYGKSKEIIKKFDLKSYFFTNNTIKDIFEKIFEKDLCDVKNLMDIIDDDNIKDFVKNRIFSPDFVNIKNEDHKFNNIVDRIIDLKKNFYLMKNENIKEKIRLAELYNDDELLKELQEEKTVLINEILKLEKLQEIKR